MTHPGMMVKEERLRRRLLNLAAEARDATDPAVLAKRTSDELWCGMEDGDLVIRYGGVFLVAVNEDTLRRMRDEDELTVHLAELLSVPDSLG